ncbi:hypothetical protein AG0111_0g12314 [Alternaria gaisen]|uniref:Uncharacterized protein n=1 Tax=Alternaria gaisen TaxID=167740 RepID=A0ACB6F4M9_9PLEO|nr:hypothetical protein AG0111_0g12314 [Alternaria gaisen]
MDDGWFAGINVQDRQAAKRAAEESSIEWQNDRYTGQLYPADKKTLKMFLAECGAYGDLTESFGPRRSYDLEDSDSGSGTDHYGSKATGSDDAAGGELDGSDATRSEDGSQEENEEDEVRESENEEHETDE